MWKGEISDFRDITTGVPQGSFLGLTLFNIFINNISTKCQSVSMKFTDETKLGGFLNTEEDQILDRKPWRTRVIEMG